MKNLFNSFILLISLNVVVSCINNNAELIELINGEWAVTYVYYKDEEISGVDRDSPLIMPNPMFIYLDKESITVPIKSDETLFANVDLNIKNDTIFFHISKADDERFNGKYLIDISVDDSNPRYNEYEILLKSENVYIYGFRSILKKEYQLQF